MLCDDLKNWRKSFPIGDLDAELQQFNSALTTSPFSIHPELLELLDTPNGCTGKQGSV